MTGSSVQELVFILHKGFEGLFRVLLYITSVILPSGQVFWEQFNTVIHSNSDLSNIDYLNSVLEKNATDTVAGLALNSANYEEAVSVKFLETAL